MSSNSGILMDEDGDCPDWIEIYNAGTKQLNLKGYGLSDFQANLFKWEFPEVTIGPGDYLVVFASGKDHSDPCGPYLHTSFRISAAGETILLTEPGGRVIDQVSTNIMPSNISYGRQRYPRNQWSYYMEPTPGAANDTGAFDHDQIWNMPEAVDRPVRINEFMAANRTSIIDEDGDLSDWIELYNPGVSPVNLSSYHLSDKADDPYKWRFPDVTLAPGEYLVIFASGKIRPDSAGPCLHTNFRLNTDDDTLVLSSNGEIIDRIRIANMVDNVSYGRDTENPERWLYFPNPTPGEANCTQGYEELTGNALPEALRINEVGAANGAAIADEDDDFPDWIELCNVGETAVNLQGYGLSDKEDDPFRWTFPAVTVKPGQRLLVFASGKDRKGNPLHTNFKIKPSGETLFLTHPCGIRLDSLATGKLSPGISAGRLPAGDEKRLFFTRASPGAANTAAGYSGYALQPKLSHRGGFYDAPFLLSIEPPSAAANVHYTLEGSEPSEKSPLYRKPLFINRTTVFRARSFEEGKLPSPPVNRTFFIGERHSLPVILIMLDPADLWDPVRGIYVKGYGAAKKFPYRGANFWLDMEKKIHFEFYEPNGKIGVSFDGGLKVGGQYSRAMPQKSFNIYARNIYGHNEIHYPFFPGNPLAKFKALTVRTAGQDGSFSRIRDIMLSSLLEDTGLDYQDHRQAVLYLNGEYWGLCNLRERINRYFVAYKHDLDPDNIDLLQANWIVKAGSADHYLALLSFVRRNDLRRPENYAYVQTQMDVDNYIDYLVAQIFFAQTDNANIRYWREAGPGGKWRWITYDLDWCFWPDHVTYNTLAHVTHPEGTGVNRVLSTLLTVKLMENRDFQERFIERFAYHLNNTFAPQRVIARIDQLAANIEPEMARHLERWGGTMEEWRTHVQHLRDFALMRPAIVARHIQRKFGLSDQEMEIFDCFQKEIK